MQRKTCKPGIGPGSGPAKAGSFGPGPAFRNLRTRPRPAGIIEETSASQQNKSKTLLKARIPRLLFMKSPDYGITLGVCLSVVLSATLQSHPDNSTTPGPFGPIF